MIAVFQYAGLPTQDWLGMAHSPDRQAYGNLRQRNQMASLATMSCLSLILWQELTRSASNRNCILRQHGHILLIAMLALVNVMTGSRTGVLQWCLLSLCLGWLLQGTTVSVRKSARCGLLSLLISITLLPDISLWLGNGNLGLLSRFGDPNALSRLSLWGNVFELIAQKPILGHGWGSLAYAHYSNEFTGVRFMELLDNAHNLPLHLAVELGLPVALAFCGLVLWLIWRNKPWAETRPDRLLAWGVLMVIGIHSLVEYPLWYGPFFMTALICIGILCADVWQSWLLAQALSVQRAIQVGVRGLALLLWVCTGYATFDYHRVSQIYLQPEQRSSWYADDPLSAAQRSVLFQNHAKFAELVITPLSKETAPRVLALSSQLVQWSPEPRVIEKLIESAAMLQLDELAAFHLKCYRRAYPVAYHNWAKTPGIQR